jgi:hypothetical protein
VFGAATLDRLLVGGRELVSDGHLLSADEEQLAQAAKWAAETLEARAAA